MRVLVTGGSGHIGSETVEGLRDDGHDVYILDPQPPRDDILKRKWLEGYVEDPATPDRIFETLGKVPSAVVHLAGVLGTEELWKDPAHAVEVNTIGTLRVLEGAKEAGAAYIGIETGTPWKTPYSITKRAAREFAEGYAIKYGTRTTTLRVFNVFGPGPSLPSKVVPRFITAALEGEPLVCFRGGEQALDLISIESVVFAVRQAVTKAPGLGEVLDVGSGVARSVLEFAQAVIRLSNSKSNIVKVPAGRLGEGAEHPVASVARTVEALDWVPMDANDAMFEANLRDTIEWYRSNLTVSVV